ncbi:MAG: winged helix-turn-helix transcriptional regulator [Candidatus Bathyarchaeota archaeon]|nr:MAG: winged helix-turn-helix transcriptional regulator [Candidatus Bathyarchaeota archaeon]
MRRILHQRLLRELLKNSKRSDRELAKILKVSQPTITRTRHKLEKNGMIQDYTVIPDFRKMGFELLVINLAKLRPEILLSEKSEKLREFAARFPNTIFASAGEGMGMNAIRISLYRNYTEYQNSLNLMKNEWKDIIEDIQSFIVAIGEGEFKRFSLTHLKDVSL